MKIPKKIQAIILIVVFILSIVFPLFKTKAADLTAISDTMSRMKTEESSNHTIKFTTPAGRTAIGDTITIEFPTGFDASTVVHTDMDLSCGASTGYETELTLAAAAGTGEWGASFTGQILTLTHPTDATGDITATHKVVVEIGTHTADPGVHQIGNQTTAENNTDAVIEIGGNNSFDSGSFAVEIVADDQVVVNATVDPSITFTINGGGTVSMGTVTTSALSIENHTIVTTTNAPSGYTATVLENNDLRSTTTPADTIDDVGDGTVTIAAEEYGMATSDTGVDITTDTGSGTTGEASAITGTAQSVATSNASVTSDTITIYYKAAIAGTTVAHSDYTHTVTYICTGNF